MKVLVALLIISVAAILLIVAAIWWRLRWHLRRSDQALKDALAQIQPEEKVIE